MEYQEDGVQCRKVLAVYPKNFLCETKFRNQITTINLRSPYSRRFSIEDGGSTNGENGDERFYTKSLNKRRRQCARTTPHFAADHGLNIVTICMLCVCMNPFYGNVTNVIPSLVLLEYSLFLHVTVCFQFKKSIKYSYTVFFSFLL